MSKNGFYTCCYYRVLSPKAEAPDPQPVLCPSQAATLGYLELGYANGISPIIHAAACPGEIWAADVNPVTCSVRKITSPRSSANERTAAAPLAHRRCSQQRIHSLFVVDCD